MTAMASESVSYKLDEGFDLDIRIDDLDQEESDRDYRASHAGSCTDCCPTVGCFTTYSGCTTVIYCTEATCKN
jgi:hypothetical protein